MRVQEVLYKRPKLILPVMTVTNWSGFGHQPANDGVEIVSSSASDVCKCTIWGTTYGSNLVVSETVTLTGTDAVSLTKTNWGNIIGVMLADKNGRYMTAAVGTITIREASGNAAITTITAGHYHSGMLILEIPGEEFDCSIFSGNLYWNPLAIATATNGIRVTSSNVVSSKTQNRVSFISDNTGASIQIVTVE